MRKKTPNLKSRKKNKQLSTKDKWDKFQISSKFIIPIILIAFGFKLNTTINQNDIKVQYLNLAIGILQNETESEISKELNLWAGNILKSYSPIKMQDGLEQAILEGTIQLPKLSAPNFLNISSHPNSESEVLLEWSQIDAAFNYLQTHSPHKDSKVENEID